MKNLNLDTRTLPVKSTNLRAVANADGTTTVEGRAIVFNEPSQPLPFVEYIDPNALDDVDFSHTLLLYGHDFNQILARADAGSLSVNIDDKGLTFKATLPDTTLAHDTRENINSGNVQGCSFGFKIADGGDTWDTSSDGTAIHYVNKIETVDELTLTPIPAYTQTSVQVQRSLDKLINKEERANMNSSNASSAASSTAASQTSSTATSSAALTASDVAAAIAAAIKPISSAVSSLVDRQCHNDSSDEDRAAKRDDGVDDVDSDDADLGVDDDETDDTRDSAADSSDSKGCQRSSAASSAASSSAAVSDSTASSASSDSTRSTNPQNKEDESKMIKITNNEDSKKEEQLRDFAHYLVTREIRPTLKREVPSTPVNGVGLTTGGVLIPETIMAPDHETHQFPRMEQYVHSVPVSTTTGKQPYFEENTGVLQTKAEFDHAKDVSLSAMKFINWDLKTYAGKLALSRDLLMDSEKGSSENWLAEAQSQMRDLQDNTNDALISAALQNGTTAKTATDAVADMKTVLNVGLKPQDSGNAQIILTQSAYNALDQLKDGFGRPMLQPDPTAKTSNLLFGKPVVVVDDALFGKAGDAVAVIAPLKKVIYDFQMGQVSGQFIDNFDIFDTTLGVFIRKDVVNGRPDLVNILKLTDKSLAASDKSTSLGK